MQLDLIKSQLNSAIKLTYLDSVGSTNSYLLAMPDVFADNSAHLLIAKQQTAGKGRNGNTWISDSGKSLTMSIALKVAKTADISLIPVSIALILAELLSKHSKQTIKIKWPNDLYVELNGEVAKFAGILVDVNQSDYYQIVIGIGINVNQINVSGADYNIGHYQSDLCNESLVANIANAIYYKLSLNYPSQIDTDKYQKYDLLANKLVQVGDLTVTKTADFIGVAMGINPNGHLLVKDESGQYQRIISQKRIRVL